MAWQLCSRTKHDIYIGRVGQANKMERMGKCFTFDDIMNWAKEEYAGREGQQRLYL